MGKDTKFKKIVAPLEQRREVDGVANKSHGIGARSVKILPRMSSYDGKLPTTSEKIANILALPERPSNSPDDDPPPASPPAAARIDGKRSRDRSPSYRGGKGKRVWPDDMHRVVIESHVSGSCECGHPFSAKYGINREKLSIQPDSYFLVTRRDVSRRCRRCFTDERVKVSSGVSWKRAYSDAFIAETAVKRFVEFMPYYRQEESALYSGIELCRSTLSRLIIGTLPHIRPVYNALKDEVMSSYNLMLDETAIQHLRSKKLSWCWVALRDHRRFDVNSRPAVIMHFAKSRESKVVVDFLRGSRAKIAQVDGYTGYNALTKLDTKQSPIKLAYCNAHARRRFANLVLEEKDASGFALEMLEMYCKVYAIENKLIGNAPSGRERGRAKSGTIMGEMKAQAIAKMDRISKKSDLYVALAYFVKHFDGLTIFIRDGQVEIDNNLVENQMRPIAMLRRNCRFVASDGGGEAWMLYASLLSTCIMNGINPRIYLNWLFEKISKHPPLSEIPKLLPWHCDEGRHGFVPGHEPEEWEKKLDNLIAEVTVRASNAS